MSGPSPLKRENLQSGTVLKKILLLGFLNHQVQDRAGYRPVIALVAKLTAGVIDQKVHSSSLQQSSRKGLSPRTPRKIFQGVLGAQALPRSRTKPEIEGAGNLQHNSSLQTLPICAAASNCCVTDTPPWQYIKSDNLRSMPPAWMISARRNWRRCYRCQ